MCTAGTAASATALAAPLPRRSAPLPKAPALHALTRFTSAAVWLLLWSCLALFAIFQHGPMPLYSTRTLAVAWEMWNSGQFLVPHINGQPYSHKVPLLFWLIHAGWAVFGVGDVWPRVLQVGIGAGWLAASAALARRALVLRPEAAAHVPWLLIPLTYPFLFGLQIMYETLLALCVVLALLAVHGRPRWGWFAVALGAGLLTKGPVMLLHVAFPLLLGPWWSEYARADRRGWYLRAGATVGAGLAILLAWALPAGMAGGEAYRNELFFLQTAGRVVDSFDHARPLYWYLPMLLVLLFPWVAWPRLWRAAFAQRPRLDDTARFLASWLLPTFGVFCLVSGKQVYYLLPLLPAAGIALALVLARDLPPAPFARRRWTAWPLALLLIGLALALLALSTGLVDAQRGSRWLADIAGVGGWFAPGFILLGTVLLWPHQRHELERTATIALCAAVLAQVLFAQSLFHNFDLRPPPRGSLSPRPPAGRSRTSAATPASSISSAVSHSRSTTSTRATCPPGPSNIPTEWSCAIPPVPIRLRRTAPNGHSRSAPASSRSGMRPHCRRRSAPRGPPGTTRPTPHPDPGTPQNGVSPASLRTGVRKAGWPAAHDQSSSSRPGPILVKGQRIRARKNRVYSAVMSSSSDDDDIAP